LPFNAEDAENERRATVANSFWNEFDPTGGDRAYDWRSLMGGRVRNSAEFLNELSAVLTTAP
jgi:hypothetical protein